MERRREQPPRGAGNTTPDSGSSGDGDGLAQLRAAGVRQQDATDRAIANALSGDSERFLRGSRQRGGQ
jgi:hypothetical protein